MTRIENFKLIEGIASDVRQSRIAITPYDGFGAPWDDSYECFFLLSGTPVALRVSNPIFIENGEAVRVVGRHNWNGVFDAVAYYNRSSRVSGNSDQALSQRQAIWMAALGGILLVFFLFFVFVISSILDIRYDSDGALFVSIGGGLFGAMGLVLVLVGWIMLARRRSEIRTIGSLLAPWRQF
jgi:hypothetical protein